MAVLWSDRRDAGRLHPEALQLPAGRGHHPALLRADPAGAVPRAQQADPAPGPEDAEPAAGQAPDDRQGRRLRHLQDPREQEQGVHGEREGREKIQYKYE